MNGRLAAAGGYTGDADTIEGPYGAAPILFAPAWTGIPDGAVGFVHLPCDAPPPDINLDGFGDPMTPRIPLGDGWW